MRGGGRRGGAGGAGGNQRPLVLGGPALRQPVEGKITSKGTHCAGSGAVCWSRISGCFLCSVSQLEQSGSFGHFGLISLPVPRGMRGSITGPFI